MPKRQYLFMLVLITGAGFLGGWLSSSLLSPQAVRAEGNALRAEKFEVIDKQGNVVAALGTAPDGMPGLAFLDQNGKPVAVLGMAPRRAASLTFLNSDGRIRASFGVTPAGEALFALNDRTGATKIGLASSGGGEAGLVAFDTQGKLAWSAP